MATAKRTQPPTPPKAGTRPSVRVDDQLAADLAVVMRTGANLSDAVRLCVRQVADQYRTAWAAGVVPVGTAPELLAYQLKQDPVMPPPRPTPAPPVTSGYDARRTLPGPAVGHPAPTVAPPPAPVAPVPVSVGQQAAPVPRWRRLFRPAGPVPGVPIRHP